MSEGTMAEHDTCMYYIDATRLSCGEDAWILRDGSSAGIAIGAFNPSYSSNLKASIGLTLCGEHYVKLWKDVFGIDFNSANTTNPLDYNSPELERIVR